MLENIKIFLWTWPCSVLLIITGMLIMIKTRFFYIINFCDIIKNTLLKIKNNRQAFKVMCTSLGGTIGVGNAIGVAGAIAEGGAGAVFWMALAGIFSMSIKAKEIELSIKYKKSKFEKGAISYIQNGIGSHTFALIYAFLCIFVSLGMGNLSQIKSALNATSSTIKISQTTVAFLFCFIFFVIIIKGLNKIISISEFLVPVISLLYIIGLVIILIINISKLPLVISKIFEGSGIICGFKWSLIKRSVSEGFSKSIFSSEAGLGNAGFVHSETNVSPLEQSKWGALEVFIDTLICILTALALMLSKAPSSFYNYSFATKGIFEMNFGVFGADFYAISMLLFAFSSMLCWYYIGCYAIKYITYSKLVEVIYTIVFLSLITLSPFIKENIIMNLSDIANALMMIVNLSAIIVVINIKN